MIAPATPEHPFLDESFEIRWSTLTPERVVPDIREGLRRAQEEIDAIARLADAPDPELTYDKTLAAFEAATESLAQAWGKVNHLDSVSNSEVLREAVNEILPEVSSFFARVPLNEDLWKVIRRYGDLSESQNLSPTRVRFLKETLLDFKQHGADLPSDKKERLEKLEGELAQLTQKFSENVLDSTNAWELVVEDTDRLRGLPPSALENARQSALQKELGSEEAPVYRFTLHAPSFMPVLKYADDAGLRQEIWEAATTIGTGKWDNTPLIWKILELRQEKAALLGKSNFGDLVLERRMAKNGPEALKFVEDLFLRTKPAFDQECRELESYKKRESGASGPLDPWDVSYFAEKQLKAEYDFNEEDLRPYFPINKVIAGLFELASRIFGLSIQERPTRAQPEPVDEAVEVWHPEVQFYDLFESENARHLGSFYADWHPRESKRSGAWMGYLRTGDRDQGVNPTPHLGYIMGNLTPGSRDKPALLTHDEVLTIFHEFGHLLHHLCGNVEVKSLNGVNVAWDFVELPSQIMENWCWERESLDLFARHYETDEPIPDDIFRKMIASRNFLSASAMIRQLSLGKMDLELHLHYARKEDRPALAEEDLDAFVRQWLKPYLMPLSRETPTILRRFTHLFAGATGYAAGYYSYKWAEVLDADAFSKFKEHGILNPETGREFREKILSRGNSEDPSQLFRDFMGRDPDPEALLVRSGLA